MPARIRYGPWLGCVGLLIALAWCGAQDIPVSGPAAEKRFPPLKLPPGFKATLYAADPMVEYLSAVALGPKRGSIFVAADYMTGLGTEIIRRDEIRLLEDTDGDGYANKATVFATGFNSIQGLTYHDGTLYVMHAPFLTALRDTKGTGQADERIDLLSGLGLPPEKNPPRLHCANGLVMGHDGWLYLALGDHGCRVPRKGMSDLVLDGGGILRCRADGSNLHVFATGLRNIYDVALDEDLNVFVRDNENDGGDYMIRVCHSFFGADHGYPYLYYEHPDEAVAPLADLGLGSSAGGLCYLETLFPPEYHGNLFFCEWGKSVVRYKPERAGSGFAKMKEHEFASNAASDPYPFKPTDLIVDHDGALIVVDWADGQRPKRGRGRIYRVMPVEPSKAIAKTGGLPDRLDSPSYYARSAAQTAVVKRGAYGAIMLHAANRIIGVRGRMHVVWALAQVKKSLRELLDIARSDPEPRVQVQALRAVADLADPSLGGNVKDSPRLAAELADLARGKDPRVVLEVLLTLGRLQWPELPQRLEPLLVKPDPTLEHAAMQALRRCGNWPGVLKLLDLPDKDLRRTLALRAVADRIEPVVADGLIERLRTEKDAARRLAYADLLTRIAHKPGPWVYWGYRPPPRPANTEAWDRTAAIGDALGRVLADPDKKVRLAILKRMQREKIAIKPEVLRESLVGIIGDRDNDTASRLLGLAMLADQLGDQAASMMLDLAKTLDDGPVLAELLKRLGPKTHAALPGYLRGKLSSTAPEVRAGALDLLASQKAAEAADVLRLLDDSDARVRRAAVSAAGIMRHGAAGDVLLRRVADIDPKVRAASLDALRLLRDMRAVPASLAALNDAATELAGLECLLELGSTADAGAVTKLALRSPSAPIQDRAIRGLFFWSRAKGSSAATRAEFDRSIAEIQGQHGILTRWQLTVVASEKGSAKLAVDDLTKAPFVSKLAEGWVTVFATGPEGRVQLGQTDIGMWHSFSDVLVPEARDVQFLGSSSSAYRVWVNGKELFAKDKAGPFQPDADRFNAKLDQGLNRVHFVVRSAGKPADFQLRFRKTSSKAEHEKLTEAVLTRKGNPERGRKVFLATEKSLCLKCHRLDNQGEKVGPELTGVGSRFSRIYLVESILEPSRTIAPSFDSVLIELKDGRVLTGIPIQETEATLTLADNQGQKHALTKSAIAERRRHPLSTMPEGLEQRLTMDEFVDLIAFLAAQKAEGR